MFMKIKSIALIGNPNCGKTTLFNTLTGTYQKTGNWTGVTTESKEGVYKKDKSIKIIDLPGLYSLNTFSKDESVVLDYLKNTPPDVVINIVDGTNLERNLYLTCELSRLNIPTIIAINMADELEKNNVKLNENVLSKLSGVPVIRISALKNINISKLIELAKEANKPIRIEKAFNDYKQIYSFIEQNISEIVTKKQTRSEKFTQKADNILLHRMLGLPIFFCVITLVYFLSSKIGGFFGSHVATVFNDITNQVDYYLSIYGVPSFLINLVCDAIIKGVGTVSSFLPQIMILFALLAVIEESGYASRIAFLLDRIFKSFGLSGKSIIPLTVSCGCTVTGLMSTRTIENISERRMTVFLSPFMPCGAKTAVFGWFASVFFGGSALVATSAYFLSITCTVLFGALLKRFNAFKVGSGSFILEIPTLRAPSIKDVAFVLWEKFKDFTVKAGTIVFLVSVALWILENVGIGGYTNGKVEQSFLYLIGNTLRYVFIPLGFGSWQASVSVLSGIFAKEAVVETISLICTDPTTLFSSSFSVYAFMAFVLLSPPCMASIITAKRELVSNKWLIGMLLFHFITAYTVAFIINVLGILLQSSIGLILSLIIGIIIIIVCAFCVKCMKSKSCANCNACKKGELCQSIKKHFTT